MGSNSRLRGDSPQRGHRARPVPARVNAGFGRPRRVVCGRRSCMLPLGSGCQGQSRGSRAQRRPRREEQGAPPAGPRGRKRDPRRTKSPAGLGRAGGRHAVAPERRAARPGTGLQVPRAPRSSRAGRPHAPRGLEPDAGRVSVPGRCGATAGAKSWDTTRLRRAGTGRRRRPGSHRESAQTRRGAGGARGLRGPQGSSRPHGGAPTRPLRTRQGFKVKAAGVLPRDTESAPACARGPPRNARVSGTGALCAGVGVPAAGRRAGAHGPGAATVVQAAATVVQARPGALPAAPGSEARWARVPLSWARTTPGRAEGCQGAKAGPRVASAAGELVLSGASGTALRRR